MKNQWNRNGEGYSDRTAGMAIQNITHEERKLAVTDPRRQIIGRRSKAAGDTFERWNDRTERNELEAIREEKMKAEQEKPTQMSLADFMEM